MRPEVIGLRFLPTDQELVIGYLLGKLTGMPLPSDKHVFDCDLYGGEEPWEIWTRFRGGGACSGFRYFGDDEAEDLYFLTPLKKKNLNAIRLDRSVGSCGGSWHEESSNASTSSDGRISWVMKRLCYKRKNNKKKKKNQQQPNYGGGGGYDDQVTWIMHEYSLDQPLPWLGLDGASFKSHALCRIRKKETANYKKRKLAEPPRVFLVEIDEDGYREDEKMEIGPPAALTTATTTSFSDHSVSDAAAIPDFKIISASSFFPYYSVPTAATATTSSDHCVPAPAIVATSSSSTHCVPATTSGDDSASTPTLLLAAEVLVSPNPDWDVLDFGEFLQDDEFCGGAAEFCCQSNGNALPLSC
ncbi:unnamed protein product [Linum trigynum]|uniref:NAC domain-containing protein n=1 Tax=Linum trigynum TaxID=586398 RepID=A0AAV2DGY5_9ROSI